ncbi:MAG: TenA family protein [Halorubrum sp.]
MSASFGPYAADREDPRFTEWLRERAEPDWTAAGTHRFARELGDGALDDEVFRRYLIRDDAFLETLIGTFGHAVGEAPTMEAKASLVDFLAVLVPAEWVYLEWASRVADRDPDRPYLAAWIDLHAVDAFADFVGWLRRELDREGAAASPRRRERLDRLFRRTVESDGGRVDADEEVDGS